MNWRLPDHWINTFAALAIVGMLSVLSVLFAVVDLIVRKVMM
jgi:hypothetical protein